MKLVWLLLLTACPGFGDRTLDELVGVPDQTPSWNVEMRPFFITNCGCHGEVAQAGAPAYFRLDKYTTTDIEDGGRLGVLEQQSLVLQRAVQNQPAPMPPGSPLSDEAKVLLRRWIEAGAPLEAP